MDRIINYISHTGSTTPMTPLQVAKLTCEGWEPLVVDMFNDMFALGWDGRLWQIKEKFGALRVYIDEAPDVVRDRVTKAEYDSMQICDTCGKEGKLWHDSWIRTMCQPCHTASLAK